MIQLRGLTKSYRTKAGRRYIFRDLNVDIPVRTNVALLGGNGAGKSTLMRILGGIDHPDSGKVITDHSISWPLALAGGFQGSLSGRENVKFVCRVYGRQSELNDKLNFIKEFSGIGDYFEEPVKTYSSGMRSRLTFAVSMAFEFDVYLVDEITAVGDQSFREQSKKAFEDLRNKSGVIMVSHNLAALREQCDMGILLHQGKAHVYHQIDEAIHQFRKLQ